jgi:hypothetical protein
MSNLKPISLKFNHHAMQRTAVEHHCCQHRTVVLLVPHDAALPASGSPPRWILSPGLLACDRPAAKPLPKVSRFVLHRTNVLVPGPEMARGGVPDCPSSLLPMNLANRDRLGSNVPGSGFDRR